MTKEIALKDLVLEEIKAEEYDRNLVADFLMLKEVPERLKNYILKLYDAVDNVGGQVVKIGKIIVAKIIEFVKANPNMAIGMALGAAAGALASLFVGWVPLVGHLLTGIMIGAGIFIGAIAGYHLDQFEKGEPVDNSLVGIFSDTLSIAKKFFALIMDIIQTLQKS